MQINELRIQRGRLVDEMRRLNESTKGQMSTDQEIRWQELDREQSAIQKRIDREQRQFDLDNEMRQIANPAGPAIFEPIGSENTTTSSSRRQNYRALFGQPSSHSEYKNFAEFASEVASGRYSDRLQRRALTVSSDTAAGYSVPEQYASAILDSSLENEIVRSLATVYPMSSSKLHIPSWNNYDHSSSVYGGFTAAWTAEDGTLSVTAPTLERISLTAHKLYLFTEISRELRDDSSGFQNDLQGAMQRALGHTLDTAFLTGSGVSQPLGILNSPCKVTVAKENAQTAATINFANLTGMWSRLLPMSAPRAVWIGHPSIVPQLLSMTRSTGTYSGESIPLFNPSTGSFQILGRPLYLTEKVPQLGTEGDLILCDPSLYIIGLRQDLVIDATEAFNFNRDRVSIRALLRVDGMMGYTTAMTPKNGSSTLSPVVTLATRS